MEAILTLSSLVSASPISRKTLPEQNKPIPKPKSKESSKTMDQLKQLHCDLTKKGLNGRVSNVTELVSKLSELGTTESLDYARRAFELFKEEEQSKGTLFMYNSLIRGYSSSGLGDEAISVYVKMVFMGFSPDKYTFPFVLSGCAKAEAFSEGIQIHGVLVKKGLEGDMFVRNSLIHFYAECGDLKDAQKVFDDMPERNVVSWTSLICGYTRKEFSARAVSLFFEMVEAGVSPNSVTMVCVISACSKLNDLGLCEKVRGYIDELGVKVNAFMVNGLVDMYLKCGDSDSAKRLFEGVSEKSLVLCNTMMSNHVRLGQCREALDVFYEMLKRGPRPDQVTLLSAISSCSQLGQGWLGRSCHGYALRNRLESWDSISNALIDMYMKLGSEETAIRVFEKMTNKTVVSWNSLVAGFAKNGDLESASRVFTEMPERDLVSWNSMIGGFTNAGRFEEAIELFREMQRKGVRADKVTMVEIASACGYLGTLDFAKWIEIFVRKNKIDRDLRLGTALVDMFARCGESESAIRVFEEMPRKDVSTWTAAIRAMGIKGDSDRAVEIFHEMIRQGIKPDKVVFVELLAACSHGGNVEKGQEIFNSMEDKFGISPMIIHFGCMVDLLGRAGLLREALDFIESMPIEANDVIWGSFLAACRTRKDTEMASLAANRLEKFDSVRTGVHVLLSNIYALAGRWDDVARVRLRLKEKGLRKIPGTSSIEVDGTVHEFSSGNDSHPERSRIETMLDEIHYGLGEAGFVPDLGNVILDVDEDEKQFLLGRHSEKLAIAFGLISTGNGIPIRVVKNLRMCSDCHLFAKVVSRIYGREIVVRDYRRFHFFKDGICSCGDYW